ncbi:hypothetical protein [Geminocystis sp.]|uniref:hypothetical protein n=1 Tax=Geminocystis sp. TaxID=2664100 RepID=UPI0035940116
MLNILKRTYKNIFAPMGNNVINQILSEGFPQELKSSLTYLITHKVDLKIQIINFQDS